MKKPIIAMLMLATLASCKKDKNEETAPTIVGTWRPSHVITLSGKDNAILETKNYTDCEKATAYIFDANGTYTMMYVQKPGDNCDQTPFTGNGTYDYNPATKKLKIIIDTNTTEVDVLTITQTEMRYGIPAGDKNGDGTEDVLAVVFNR